MPRRSENRPPMLVRASEDIARALVGKQARRASVQRGSWIDPAPGMVIDSDAEQPAEQSVVPVDPDEHTR